MSKRQMTIKPERLGTTQDKQYDDNAETMCNYHKKIIKVLCKKYKDKELKEKLSKLQFCSLETALKVAEQYVKQ